jgi:hypothetical protein
LRLLWSSLISIVRYWTIWSMPQWFVILYWLGILICINIFIITISIKTIYAVFSYFWWGGRCLNTVCLMSRKIPHLKPLQHLATDFVRCQHPILNIPIFISIGNMQIGRIQDCTVGNLNCDGMKWLTTPIHTLLSNILVSALKKVSNWDYPMLSPIFGT